MINESSQLVHVLVYDSDTNFHSFVTLNRYRETLDLLLPAVIATYFESSSRRLQSIQEPCLFKHKQLK